RCRIRREPDLTNRPERALGHELIQHVEGLHRDGEADAGLEIRGKKPGVTGLAADHAIVAAVEEAHELDLGGAAFPHDAAALSVGATDRTVLALGGGAWRGHPDSFPPLTFPAGSPRTLPPR